MKYYRIVMALIILTTSLMLCSCMSKRKITDSDMLTKDEEKMLVTNAREILLSSKNVKLTPDERNFITNTKPETGFTYTGYKEGRGMVSWLINDKKRVNMKVDGELLEAERQWQINIIRTEETQFVDPRKAPPVTAEEFKK